MTTRRRTKRPRHRRQASEAQREIEGPARKGVLRQFEQPTVLLADFPAEEIRAKRGHERERERQRADEREDDGDGHRLEHFPLDAGEREDREIDDGDDKHAEEHRAGRLPSQQQHFV